MSVKPAKNPSVPPPTVALADQLHSAAIRLLRRVRAVDVVSGVTAPRLSALSVVVLAGPLTLGDLAAAEQVRAPTMSRLTDALEKAGLVRRETDRADGRRVLIRATDKGTRTLHEGRRRRVELLARQLTELSGADLGRLHAAVKILQSLELAN